ncbi:MAG: nucleotidyltransferase domain-containing protein [Candidatus Ornithomonoglobus sp.]
MCSKSLLNKLIMQLTEYSKSVFGENLKSIILYGSYARGDYTDESDIDIMVMVDMTPEELNKYRWGFSCFTADLNVENNVFIAVKLQSVKLFERWKNTLPFYKNILKDGVVFA